MSLQDGPAKSQEVSVNLRLERNALSFCDSIVFDEAAPPAVTGGMIRPRMWIPAFGEMKAERASQGGFAGRMIGGTS